MKLVFSTLMLLSISFTAFGQNRAEDSVVLAQTVSWLGQKLTYNYYNGDDSEWWQNRFDFDPLTAKTTIRNISTERLGAIQDRTHVQRTFYFGDLNPYNIYVEQTKANAGRLVKGKTIRIGTYQQAKAIKQIKNGSIPSEASFLYFSIPAVYEDSAKNYTQDIVEKFEKAIMLATKVYPTGSFNGDASQLFNILENDRFQAEGGGVMEVSRIFEDVLQLNQYDEKDQLLRRGFLKINPGDGSIKWIGIKALDPAIDKNLKFGPAPEFVISSGDFKILFINKHEFHILENGNKSVFIRDNSFEKGRPYYR